MLNSFYGQAIFSLVMLLGFWLGIYGAYAKRLGPVAQFGGPHASVDDCTGQQDAAEVGQGVLVVPGGDAAPLLEPVEPALDGVAQPVAGGVECGRPTAC